MREFSSFIIYKLLRIGEKLQEGDEFFNGKEWITVSKACIASTVVGLGTFRRFVKEDKKKKKRLIMG